MFHFTPNSHTLGDLHKKKCSEPRNGRSSVVQNLQQRAWLMVDKGITLNILVEISPERNGAE